jgi:SRSO17 transposase
MGGRLVEGPTMAGKTLDWREELGRFLKPFVDRLGHKARRRMCPLYVSGLIGPGDRKSIAPMAKRLALGECDQLHHFIAAGVWDAAPLETELLVQADRLVGGRDAVLVIDDTAIPKKGRHSVGVAPQYASALGKTSNCQTLVSLTLARGEVPIMLALRLFLPESWTSKRARLERAGVPVEYRTARTKLEIALAEIDRVIAAGVRFNCVLADAGYGQSALFRQELTARNLRWAVGIPRHLKVYPADVRMIWPVAKRGRPRQRHVPDILSISAEDMLASAKWHTISWRTGTKGKLKARFAAVRVRVADGPQQRIRDKGQQHMPGDEAWLIGEHRPAHLGGHHQSALDLRAGPPAAERRTRSRSLRGSILAGPASSCAYDDDCLRFPPVSSAQSSKAEKKESTVHRRNRHCRPCAKPSSRSSLGHHLRNARTAESRLATRRGVSKSAKVELGPVDIKGIPSDSRM